jgi:hypothetical protein
VSQPPRPGPVPGPPRIPGPPSHESPAAGPTTGPAQVLAGLAGVPVAQHVAVFEAEHDRLRRELSTIDQL